MLGHRLGDLALQFEDALECTVVTFAPLQGTAVGVHQLDVHPDVAVRLQNIPRDDAADLQRLADFLERLGAVLRGGGALGDHCEPRYALEFHREIRNEAVAEIIPLASVAQHLERQHH